MPQQRHQAPLPATVGDLVAGRRNAEPDEYHPLLRPDPEATALRGRTVPASGPGRFPALAPVVAANLVGYLGRLEDDLALAAAQPRLVSYGVETSNSVAGQVVAVEVEEAGRPARPLRHFLIDDPRALTMPGGPGSRDLAGSLALEALTGGHHAGPGVQAAAVDAANALAFTLLPTLDRSGDWHLPGVMLLRAVLEALQAVEPGAVEASA